MDKSIDNPKEIKKMQCEKIKKKKAKLSLKINQLKYKQNTKSMLKDFDHVKKKKKKLTKREEKKKKEKATIAIEPLIVEAADVGPCAFTFDSILDTVENQRNQDQQMDLDDDLSIVSQFINTSATNTQAEVIQPVERTFCQEEEEEHEDSIDTQEQEQESVSDDFNEV